MNLKNKSFIILLVFFGFSLSGFSEQAAAWSVNKYGEFVGEDCQYVAYTSRPCPWQGSLDAYGKCSAANDAEYAACSERYRTGFLEFKRQKEAADEQRRQQLIEEYNNRTRAVEEQAQQNLREQQLKEAEEQQQEEQQQGEQKKVTEEFSKLQNRISSEIIDEYNRLTGNGRNPTEAEIKKLLNDLRKLKNEWNDLLKERKSVGIESVDLRDENGNAMSMDQYAKKLEGYLNEYLKKAGTKGAERQSPSASKPRVSKPKPKLEAGKKLTDLDLNLLDTLKLPAAKLHTARGKADFIQAKREIQNSEAEFIRKNGGTLEKAAKTKGGADYLKALQQKVLKQNPTDASANLMLGKIYKMEGINDVALEFNKKALGNIDNKEALEFIEKKFKEIREEKRNELKITEGAFKSPIGKKINKEFEDAAKKAGMGTVRGVAVEQLSRCAFFGSNCGKLIDSAMNLNK